MQQFSDRTIKVSVSNLLGILRNNRVAHVEDYNEAFKLFKDRYVITLQNMINDVNSGNTPKMQIDLVKPVSYEDDYTQIIEMLEMTVNTEIDITAAEFQAYVKDKWSWKKNLNVSFGSYTGKLY